MQLALEELFGELLLSTKAASREDLETLCRKHRLSAEDRAALCDNHERLLVYRDLVRGNLLEALELAIPRTKARLGPLFIEYFDAFLEQRAPHTHYLRDVTPELLAWCGPRWAVDERVPDYLHDLGRHESLQIEISALPSVTRGHEPAALELERGVELCQAARLVRYRHAVHELPADEADRSEPAAREVALFVYRSPEHDVRYLETSPLASALLEQLLLGRALGASIQLATASLSLAIDEAVLSGVAKLLADLAEREVVWGPRSDPAARPGP